MSIGIKRRLMKNLKAKWITKTPNNRLYQIPVPIIGLTGGIGTGKSTVANILREKGIVIIDADKLVKNIYQKTETFEFITQHFPTAIIEGIIHFPTLRKLAFDNLSSKTLLENFIYAELPDEFKKAYAAFIDPSFIIYDVPLLFEKKLNLLVDLSVCVYASRKIQIERIITRDHISFELASKIVDDQMNIEDKKRCSDLIIINDQGTLELKTNVDRFLEEICF